MELDWYCAGAAGMNQTKLLGGSMDFQEATSEPAGNTKKLTAWHLMPHDKHPGKQGFNSQFCNHKIFNPRKQRTVNISPFSLCSCSVFSLSAVIYLLLFNILPVVFWFSFVPSVWLPLILLLFSSICFLWLFSVIFCSDTGIVFQVFQST
jgi:hypothetical protein